MKSLIISDSNTLSQLLSMVLSSHTFTPIHRKSNDIKANDYYMYKFIFIDLELDFENPFELVKSISSKIKNSFLIGISRPNNWKSRVDFLNNGGDDVINYPFPTQELIARINTLKKRKFQKSKKVYKIDDLTINFDRNEIVKKDKRVDLNKKEYEVFEYMIRNNSRNVSRGELMDQVWDYRRSMSSNTVDVHVNKIRNKLGDKKIIKSVYGIGYRIDLHRANTEKENEYLLENIQKKYSR